MFLFKQYSKHEKGFNILYLLSWFPRDNTVSISVLMCINYIFKNKDKDTNTMGVMSVC